jgi:plasmid stability protein
LELTEMAAITVRNLSDETHLAIRRRASANGRSTEAEVRAILDDAARPSEPVGLGTAMRNAFREAGFAILEDVRDRTPVEPIDLG